ncbi:MAG TPA: M50 family metallopeptidase, partial [Caulobacteraceae bacterium]|nr:M50 family metallopeptidase [Caulobacteraceae bacterium]
MTEVGTAVPPGGDIPAPIGRAPQSPGAQLGWAVVSTLALAAWIAWQFDWVWAIAGVFGILVHETGHLLVINVLGCGPSRIHIIPFFGGAATMKRAPRTEFHGVLIALAGPAAGLLAAAPFILASVITHDPRWAGGGFFVAVINLLNLAPAPPLDGSKALGPALARIHPMVERAALLLVGAAAAYWAVRRGSYLFGTFVAIAALGSFRRGTVRPNAERLTNGQWLATVALWL